MPLTNYGVLKGIPIERRIGAGTGHYHIRVITDSETFRVSVNSRSSSDSAIRYAAIADFSHPITDGLSKLSLGFTQLERRPGSMALDYIRSNLANEDAMLSVPAGLLGAHSTMNDVLDQMILTAMSEEHAWLYAFGSRWGPEQTMDRKFGVRPASGIHNVHMNQGSKGGFKMDDGVFQDGGLIVQLGEEGRWQALFMAFESQSWLSDDLHGHEMPVRPRTVRIASASVNVGTDAEQVVSLANRTDHRIALHGWALTNSRSIRQRMEKIILEPHSSVNIPLLGDAFNLSRRGDLITLLDESGAKIDGVSYTGAQTSVPGVDLIWPERQIAATDQGASAAIEGSVFVSYSRHNSDFAMALAQELKRRRFAVWVDRWSIPPGADWNGSIDSGIKECGTFIILLSPESNQSKQVASELELALDENKRIVPLLIQDCEVPRRLRLVQYIDFRPRGSDRDKPLQELISSLQQKQRHDPSANAR